MIKKVNKLLVIVIIAVVSIIEVGCTQSKNDNFKTGGSEQSMESTVDEGEISITNESVAIETAPVTRDDTILYGSIKTIDGFQMVDGTDVPVQVSFNVTNVQAGESAYKTLISGNAEIPKAENGMEYVVVTLNVTYDSGTPDNLYIMEDYASLDSAKMYFALSNGDSNAEQFTKHLSDNIYNLTVEKGKSAQGSVAFLRKIGSNEPLYFVGYGKTIKFDIATSDRSSSVMEIGVSDILIPEIPYLAETPFMVADIEHVLAYDSELEKIEGYEGANGHYNYWKGEGIEYVTHSSEKNLAGIVINNSDYSLANGIRVGMTELELIQTGYPFEKCKSEIDNGIGMIIFGSGLLRDEKGPLNMTDYDYIYAYVGSASADEIKNYSIDRTSCYSIVLLMKDGVIDEVILDLPTAG